MRQLRGALKDRSEAEVVDEYDAALALAEMSSGAAEAPAPLPLQPIQTLAEILSVSVHF